MFKKFFLKRKIVGVIKETNYNWEEKAFFITKLVDDKKSGDEIIKDIAANNIEPEVRKGMASILGYMDKKELAPWMIERILIETDWTVRHALSSSSSRLLKGKAVELLQKEYQNRMNELEGFKQQQRMKINFVESLGAMGRKEGIPLLKEMLNAELKLVKTTSFELLNQIVYSLGEIGNETVLEFLNPLIPSLDSLKKSISNSVRHAMDKIAKNAGFSGYRNYLEKRKQ